MKLSTKIAYNTIIQIISKGLATLIGLLIVAIITRYLGKDGFGKYTTVVTFLSFFGIIADMGLTLVTVQLISKKNADKNKVLGNLLALRLVSAMLFLGLAPLLVLFFPYDAEIKKAVAIAAFSFLFIALNQIMVGLFQKELRMDKVSIAEVANRLLLLLGVILTAKYNKGLLGIMEATVVASAFSFGLHYIFSLPFARIKLLFDWPYWKYVITKSWPLALTIALNLIYLKTDILFLSIIQRPTEMGIIAEVGIYGAAYKVVDVLVTLPFIFSGIVLPLLTLHWSEKNQDGFQKLMQKSFDLMLIFTIPMIVGTQFLATDIMTLIAGRDFGPSGNVLQVLILAAGMIFLGNIFAHAVIAINKQKKAIPAYFFTAISSVVAYYYLIPRFSYFGAAYVTVYSETIIAFASIYIVWKYTGFLPRISIIFKSLAASILMIFSMYVLHYLGIFNIAILLIVASFIYFLLIFVFGGLSRKDLMNILNR